MEALFTEFLQLRCAAVCKISGLSLNFWAKVEVIFTEFLQLRCALCVLTKFLSLRCAVREGGSGAAWRPPGILEDRGGDSPAVHTSTVC